MNNNKKNKKHLKEKQSIIQHPDEPVSQAAYARYVGVTRQAIQEQVKSGRIQTTENGKVIPRQADNARSNRAESTAKAGLRLRMTIAMVEEQEAKAELARLRLEQARAIQRHDTEQSRTQSNSCYIMKHHISTTPQTRYKMNNYEFTPEEIEAIREEYGLMSLEQMQKLNQLRRDRAQDEERQRCIDQGVEYVSPAERLERYRQFLSRYAAENQQQ